MCPREEAGASQIGATMGHTIKMLWRKILRKKKQDGAGEYLAVDQCNNLGGPKIAVAKLGQTNVEELPAPKPRRKSWRRYSKRLTALLSLGAACIMLGISIILIQPYDLIFRLKARLTEGSETYELWQKPPVELYLRVFVFNVTNREGFLYRGEKLRVEEVGPFVYRENLEQDHVQFLPNGSVNSVPRHPLTLVPELSAADENATVIVPNVALLGMGNILRSASLFSKLGFNLVARQVDAEPLIEMTARDFMFGYKDPLVRLGNRFLKSWIYFDKLGLIDRMYDFGDDVVNSYTGEVESEFNLTGLIHTYNGQTHLPYWGKSDRCNRIIGASDCSKFANKIGLEDTVTIYRKPLCRPMTLKRVSEETLEGMSAYRYKFMEDAMDNGQLNPEFKCYCQGVNENNCLPHGLIDITPCFYGFPIALSYPHFFNGDPSLLDHVEGLSPDPALHDSFFLLQPDVGLPLEVAVRTQINIALQTMPGIARVHKFQSMVLPLLWSETRMYTLPRSLMTRFVLYFGVLPVFTQAGAYILLSAGSAALLAGLLGLLCKHPKSEDSCSTSSSSSSSSSSASRSLLTLSSNTPSEAA